MPDVHLLGGMDILDSEDFLVSNILLPVGALIFLLFCMLKKGWGSENFFEEVNSGKGFKLSPKITGYLKYVLPVLIILIIISGLIS